MDYKKFLGTAFIALIAFNFEPAHASATTTDTSPEALAKSKRELSKALSSKDMSAKGKLSHHDTKSHHDSKLKINSKFDSLKALKDGKTSGISSFKSLFGSSFLRKDNYPSKTGIYLGLSYKPSYSLMSFDPPALDKEFSTTLISGGLVAGYKFGGPRIEGEAFFTRFTQKGFANRNLFIEFFSGFSTLITGNIRDRMLGLGQAVDAAQKVKAEAEKFGIGVTSYMLNALYDMPIPNSTLMPFVGVGVGFDKIGFSRQDEVKALAFQGKIGASYLYKPNVEFSVALFGHKAKEVSLSGEASRKGGQAAAVVPRHKHQSSKNLIEHANNIIKHSHYDFGDGKDDNILLEDTVTDSSTALSIAANLGGKEETAEEEAARLAAEQKQQGGPGGGTEGAQLKNLEVGQQAGAEKANKVNFKDIGMEFVIKYTF